MPTITVRPDLSPRLVIIDKLYNTITAQEVVDLIRDWEDSEEGMAYDSLLKASGKEDLGGNVKVGITVELQNSQLYFEERSSPISSGNLCTSPNSKGVICISSTATFISDGVTRGSIIYNDTTRSMATVLSVDSEQQITSLPLSGGSRLDWQVDDYILVYNSEQCNIPGGNVVAVDENGDSISPVLQSPYTNVVRTSSSSATLQELESIQFSSFNGGVTYKYGSPYSGITFPTGTLQQPCNNFIDALDIAKERGLSTIYVLGNASLDNSIDFIDLTFVGESKNKSIIEIYDIATVTNCEFREATLVGVLDGNSTIEDCNIGQLTYVNGFINNCLLTNTVTLGGSSLAVFTGCYAGTLGSNIPIINLGGSGQDLIIRDYSGDLKLTNKTGTDNVVIDLDSGQLILDSTITNGTIIVRGIGKVDDQSTGSAIVDTTYLLNSENIADAIWEEDKVDHNSAGTFGEHVNNVNLDNIADSVWEEDINDHLSTGSFGEWIKKKLLTVSKYLGTK